MIVNTLYEFAQKVKDLKRSLIEVEKSVKILTDFVDENDSIADLGFLVRENERLKEEIDRLNSTVVEYNKRNNRHAKRNGWVRWLTHGSGKNPIKHLMYVMSEFKRLNPDHPVFKGEQGAEPSPLDGED